MTLHRIVNGVRQDLTADEEAAVLAEWARNAQPSPEQLRIAELDANIGATAIGTLTPKTIAELKLMDWPTFSAWFDANFDTATKIIGLVKRLLLIVIRRVA